MEQQIRDVHQLGIIDGIGIVPWLACTIAKWYSLLWKTVYYERERDSERDEAVKQLDIR